MEELPLYIASLGLILCKDSKKITLWRGNLLEERGKGDAPGEDRIRKDDFENLGGARRKVGQELSVERVLGCGMPVRAD